MDIQLVKIMSILYWGAYVGTYWFMSLFFYILDCLSEKYPKIKSWKIQTNKTIDYKKYYQTAKVVLKNQILTYPFIGSTIPLIEFIGNDVSYTCDPIYIIAKHLIMSIIIFDILFYIAHRAFHHPKLYGLIHKQHHDWTAPVACSANYNSFVDHLIANIMIPVISIVSTGANTMTMMIWFVSATITVTSSHSGYWWTSAKEHDDHHKYFKVNYGFLFTDILFGTYK
jgi:sterol desaturase/sphingolipid hydroxylase (fatty acid hydroxylase superfamily)